jgi:hypothetical protein
MARHMAELAASRADAAERDAGNTYSQGRVRANAGRQDSGAALIRAAYRADP